MHFKLIIAFVEDEKLKKVIHAAREAGATGSTVIKQTTGDGLQESKTFLGMKLEIQRDMLIFLVEEHLSREILEAIAAAGEFHKRQTGMAFQIDVEDVIGINIQIDKLTPMIEDEI